MNACFTGQTREDLLPHGVIIEESNEKELSQSLRHAIENFRASGANDGQVLSMTKLLLVYFVELLQCNIYLSETSLFASLKLCCLILIDL